jgi:hypothetical protein
MTSANLLILYFIEIKAPELYCSSKTYEGTGVEEGDNEVEQIPATSRP